MVNALQQGSRRIRLRLEFDGAEFCGWQLQSEEHESRKTSVQGEMERALRVFFRAPERVVVQGCGRTDAGVSAREFYMHFDVPEIAPMPDGEAGLEKFRHSLNGILPEGVAVTRSEFVHASFHALKDVTWKTYEYSVLLRRARPTLDRRSLLWMPETPGNFLFEPLREALALFVGTHDFVAFTASDHTAQTTEREIYKTELSVEPLPPLTDTEEAALLRLRFTGEGFLKYMVRTMSGTLLEVGSGKRDAESLRRLLDEKSHRREAGWCAPAHALCLVNVSYDPWEATA